MFGLIKTDDSQKKNGEKKIGFYLLFYLEVLTL